MKPLNHSRAYRTFVRDRNRALEQILKNNLRRIDAVIATLHDAVTGIVAAARAAKVLPTASRGIEDRISRLFQYAHIPIADIIHRQRASVYTLAYAGEAEAIGRATGRIAKADLTHDRVTAHKDDPMPGGGPVERRVEIALKRIEAKVLDAVRMGIVMEDTEEELDERIRRAFPRTRPRPQQKKLKGPKLKEARPKRKWDSGAMSTGFVDDKAWGNMVDDYLGEQIPMQAFRGPEFFLVAEEVGESVTPSYIWEIEKEVTQDFVELVREGQIEAANENGITDFVWIAVIDDRTDECCAWRDGLTTSEIRKELRGKRKDDECDAETPPAHFNCRCDLAPVTKELIDEKPTDLGDFDTWLKT